MSEKWLRASPKWLKNDPKSGSLTPKMTQKWPIWGVTKSLLGGHFVGNPEKSLFSHFSVTLMFRGSGSSTGFRDHNHERGHLKGGHLKVEFRSACSREFTISTALPEVLNLKNLKYHRVTIRGAQPSTRLSEEICLSEPSAGVSQRALRGGLSEGSAGLSGVLRGSAEFSEVFRG